MFTGTKKGCYRPEPDTKDTSKAKPPRGASGETTIGGQMYKITIPGELPSMNEIVDASKLHYMEYSKMKKEHTEAVAWIAKAGIGKKLKKIDLDITWHCKNRRKDKDNIAVGVKFILDGLVKSGVIKNDGWSEVGTIKHYFQVDKDNPRVEVIIKEV